MESLFQKKDETFSDFRLVIDEFAAQMKQPDVFRTNMSGRLKDFLLLRDVRSADELRDLCRKYEKLWAQDDAYRSARSKRDVSEIEERVKRVGMIMAHQ